MEGTAPIPLSRPQLGREEIDAAVETMRSGQLAQGRQVAEFEREFSAALGGVRCVAVNSGTSALHLGLLAAGIGPGDEVIVPSFTFAGTANAVALTGATPVFADIEADSFCLDPASASSAITPRTAAILPVHLYGHPARMDLLRDLAARHHLALFEDAAQAHLASWDGRLVGTIGTMAMFSFYATKNMTTGEGGMICTSDPAVERRCRVLRNQGMERQYENEMVGFNMRMTDLAASIGRVQLGKLEEATRRRESNARVLSAQLTGVRTPTVHPLARHVFHQYTVRVVADARPRLLEHLQSRGVAGGVYYPHPVHRLPAFDVSADLPETAHACATCLSLPIHPGLSERDLERIVEAVNAFGEVGT